MQSDLSVLTFKIKHNLDLSSELNNAKEVAQFAIENRDKLSTKYVSHLGLPAEVSCQILRKYGRNSKTKKISNAVLVVPGRGIRFNQITGTAKITCLKLSFKIETYLKNIVKINSAELDSKYISFQCSIQNNPALKRDNYLGVDRNATGFLAVCANSQTGQILKLGKQASHIRSKHQNIRKKLQSQQKFKLLRKLSKRENNKIKDLNHKIAKKIVVYAKQNKLSIKLENLKGIRRNRRKAGKAAKKLNSVISNWPFFQLEEFVKYKAKLHGVEVFHINPFMTSQNCSRCGMLGDRNKKSFNCLNENCKHFDHADVNAAFNIANAIVLRQI